MNVMLRKVNDAYGYIDTTDASLIQDIWEEFSFYSPNYKYAPNYKSGVWDGKIRLVNLYNKTFPLGLAYDISKFLEMMNYEYIIEDDIKDSFNLPIPVKEIDDFFSKFRYYVKSEEIHPRIDQKKAVYRAIKLKRCVNICPTSFGKSLSIFMQILWNIENDVRSLIIVPTVNLVHQFYSDIIDYCTFHGQMMEWTPKMHKIFSGEDKNFSKNTNLVITTWQSIYKLDDEWFDHFGCMILDECHQGQAKSLQSIFNKAENVPIRTGWTGSLENTDLNILTAKGMFGPVEKITDTSTLMDQGVVARLKIICTKFNYSNKEREEVKGMDYNSEIAYLEKCIPRTKKIVDIAASIGKTGIILHRHIEHGNDIVKYLKQKYTDRVIYHIHGNFFKRDEAKYKTMEEMKPLIEQEEKAIIVANYQILSTGINIKNIHFLIFASPVKSFVTTIQSIGRSLRINSTKKTSLLIDIADDLGSGKEMNYAMKHFRQRLDYYSNDKFQYIIKGFNI